MSNDLVSPVDLSEFPGAPYSDTVVDAAAARLRNEAGWHIAPLREETLTLDGTDGQFLILPTLKLVEVTEIRDVSSATPVILTGWRASRTKGMVYRDCGWPCGFESIEVDLSHGYDAVPADLLPEVARYCQDAAEVNTATKSSISIDDYTEVLEDSSATGESSTSAIAAYTLDPGRA